MFDTFLNQYNGQRGVGNTPENKGQCEGLVMKWLEFIGAPMILGHAKDLLTNADHNAYEVILNINSAVPQKGDVIVWDGRINNGVGRCGISTRKGELKIFQVFMANLPEGTGCRLHSYNYDYVIGWLRPKILKQKKV